MSRTISDPLIVADLAQRTGERIIAKGGRGRELIRLGSHLDGLVKLFGKRTDSQQIRAFMDELISVAKSRLDRIVQALIVETGATRADAEAAAEMTPLGRQLIELRDAATGLRMSAEQTASQLDGTDAAKSLRELQKDLDSLSPTEAVIEAIYKVEAALEKVKSGGDVSQEWLAKVKCQAQELIEGKDSKMTKKTEAPTPLDMLDKAERDQFGNVKNPAAAFDAMRKAASQTPDITKAGTANARLDGLAKALADGEGIGFYEAYDRVSSENPELLAEAVAE